MREDEMYCFDRLSKETRDLLNKAPFNFGTQSVKNTFWRYDADEATPMIESVVMQKSKQLMKEMVGRDYPHDLPLIGWERPPGPKSKRMMLHRGRRLTQIR